MAAVSLVHWDNPLRPIQYGSDRPAVPYRLGIVNQLLVCFLVDPRETNLFRANKSHSVREVHIPIPQFPFAKPADNKIRQEYPFRVKALPTDAIWQNKFLPFA